MPTMAPTMALTDDVLITPQGSGLEKRNISNYYNITLLISNATEGLGRAASPLNFNLQHHSSTEMHKYSSA